VPMPVFMAYFVRPEVRISSTTARDSSIRFHASSESSTFSLKSYSLLLYNILDCKPYLQFVNSLAFESFTVKLDHSLRIRDNLFGIFNDQSI
jgi:hypothetical protein